MQQLEPLDIPLSGKNLIQASAGTGKTWTISLLYLRLIIEQQLTVDQLLVVTYTRAATEELRDRIRSRLKTALAAYEKPQTARAEYQQLLDRYPPTAERLWCLRRALLSFDEATVFTIHGFCQRALQENAFEVGLPFDSDLMQDEHELQLNLSDQFWQQRLMQPSAIDRQLLAAGTLTPDRLLADVRAFIGRPYLVPLGITAVSDAEYTHQQQLYRALRTDVEQLWHQQQAEILALLSPQVLSQQAYKPAQLQAMSAALARVLVCPVAEVAGDLLKLLLKFTPAELAAKTKKGMTPPSHALFVAVEDLLAAAAAVQALQEHALEQLRYDLLCWLRAQLPLRKRQSGLLAFDDLLLNVQQALLARPALASALAQQYPVALIDEFQDTDPVQFAVFQRIYQDNPGALFYVGDPKQAIYSFRGADIHTYLLAAASVDATQRYTLDKNFRSCPELIAAFNHLFAVAPDPFANQQRIAYEAVRAGGVVHERLTVTAGQSASSPGAESAPLAVAPLRLWDWDGIDPIDNKLQLHSHIAQAVANDIANLLQQGQRGEALIGTQPVRSGDFAVLVRSHRQGRLIKQALQRCGIASVQKSPLGIFETHEAAELRLLLRAIAEPGNVLKVRRALVTELMGGDARSLLALDEDSGLFEAALEDFYRWNQLWARKGFMPMLRDWLMSCGIYQRLLAYIDGERRMTNLLHLAELIHAQTRERQSGMHALLRWLQQQAEQSSTQDEHQLRLESDENLVQIVTIHKSKGLQYPLVYCPFLWDEPEMRAGGQWFAWYDETDATNYLQAGGERLDEAMQRRKADEMGENLRLLYVALTRAQYQCTVVLATGEVPRFNYRSSLAWLLFGHLPAADNILAGKAQLKPAERQQLMHAQLSALTTPDGRRAAGEAVEGATGIDGASNISWSALPAVDTLSAYRPMRAPQALVAREFRHAVPAVQRIGSFSGLTSGQHNERPDHDATALQLTLPRRELRAQETFPGGARAGVCLHKMLERLDFVRPVHEQREDVVLRTLAEQGFEAHWAAAAEKLLAQTVATPLLMDDSLCLHHIEQAQRLDELEFYFPVHHLRVEHLKTILLAGLPDDQPWMQAAVQRLAFADLQGFMKGFIDLIFRHQGHYYVVDYKSNWLGDALIDYTPQRLEQAMADAHYYVQYLIYCLALHRYLGQRLGAAYHWDTHVGGALYLFLRGMTPQGDAGNGVFFHKPAFELIDALDRLMRL